MRLSLAEITRSRYTGRAKRLGGDSEGTTSVTGHRRFHRPRTRCGRICFNRQKINLSTVLPVNGRIKQADKDIWIVSFMRYDLGYVDLDAETGSPSTTLSQPKLLPMSPECSVTYVSGRTLYDVATPAVLA